MKSFLIALSLATAALAAAGSDVPLTIAEAQRRAVDRSSQVTAQEAVISASRHMVVSGLVVLAFIIFHLLHFTARKFNSQFPLMKLDPLNRYDVYSMMVYGFQNVYVSIFYIIGLFLLTLHLTHGSSSFFQSLGLNNQRLTPKLAVGGRIFAWLLFIGYVSIPIAVLLGFIKPAQQL